MFHPAPSTPWEGFLPCHSEPCYVRWPRPCPDHHATVPTAAGQHWGWQPCLLPCCHCNTGDSSHSTGVAPLCAWSSESRIPGQAALRLSCLQGHCHPPSLLLGMKAGTAFSQQHPGRTAICPQPWSLLRAKWTYFPPLLFQGKPTAICPVQRTYAGDQEAEDQVSELPPSPF